MTGNKEANRDSSMKKLFGTNRRRFLQKTAGAGIVAGLGVSAGSRQARAASCGIDEDEGSYSEINYEDKNEVSTTDQDTSMTVDYSMELQSAIVYSHSDYSSQDNRWTHFFYEGAHLVSNEKESWESSWSTSSNVYNHKLMIENKYTNSSSLFTTSDSYDVGAVPSPNGSTDSGFSDAAFTVLKFALSAKSPAFAVGTTAAGVASALLNNGESDTSEDIKDYSWTYTDSQPCEAAHYCHWLVRNYEGYSSAYVKAYEDSSTDMGSVRPQVTWDISVDPYGNYELDPVTNSSSDTNTLSKSEQVNILESTDAAVKIPYDEIKDPVRKELASGGPIYEATNPEVRIRLE